MAPVDDFYFILWFMTQIYDTANLLNGQKPLKRECHQHQIEIKQAEYLILVSSDYYKHPILILPAYKLSFHPHQTWSQILPPIISPPPPLPSPPPIRSTRVVADFGTGLSSCIVSLGVDSLENDFGLSVWDSKLKYFSDDFP